MSKTKHILVLIKQLFAVPIAFSLQNYTPPPTISLVYLKSRKPYTTEIRTQILRLTKLKSPKVLGLSVRVPPYRV